MLSLDAGLWSGFQRQMELAESFVQTLITVCLPGYLCGCCYCMLGLRLCAN